MDASASATSASAVPDRRVAHGLQRGRTTGRVRETHQLHAVDQPAHRVGDHLEPLLRPRSRRCGRGSRARRRAGARSRRRDRTRRRSPRGALAARHPLDRVGQPYGRVVRQTAAGDHRVPRAAALGPALGRVGEPEQPGRRCRPGRPGRRWTRRRRRCPRRARRWPGGTGPRPRHTAWSDVLPSTTTQNSSPPVRPGQAARAAARPKRPAARRSGPVPGRRPRGRGRR